MEIRWVMVIVFYYFMILLVFLAVPETILAGGQLNATDLDDINTSFNPDDELGDIGTGITGAIERFFIFATVGIGLPETTPAVLQLVFSAWSIFMTFVTIFTIKNAIWKG